MHTSRKLFSIFIFLTATSLVSSYSRASTGAHNNVQTTDVTVEGAHLYLASVAADTTPPAMKPKPDIILWPPNHKYQTFTAADLVELAQDSSGDSVALSIISASSDEPDNDSGDGSTMNDIIISCPDTVIVRAERAGGGDGRVYSITIAAKDISGNRSTAVAHVVVPHDHSGKHPVVQGPALYTVSTQCDTVTTRHGALILGTGDQRANTPQTSALSQNYPNPFNPTTRFQYSLPERSRLTLRIYNVLGQVVATLIDGTVDPGSRQVEWNAGNAASGIYFYKLDAVSVDHPGNSFTQVRKMMFLK